MSGWQTRRARGLATQPTLRSFQIHCWKDGFTCDDETVLDWPASKSGDDGVFLRGKKWMSLEVRRPARNMMSQDTSIRSSFRGSKIASPADAAHQETGDCL